MNRNNKNIYLIVAVIAVLLLSVITVAIIKNGKEPDFSGQSREQIREFLDSNDFRDQEPNERRQIARSAMREVITSNAREYYELTPKERVKYLDDTIDRMEEMRSKREQYIEEMKAQGKEIPQRPQRRTPKPDDMRERMESTDPVTRAQIQQFFRDIRARRQQRGLSPDPF